MAIADELERLSAAATRAYASIPGDPAWLIERDNRESAKGHLSAVLRNAVPQIIAALHAQETPLPDDVAGLVIHLESGDHLWQSSRDEIADLIERQARQLAERDAEIARLREAMDRAAVIVDRNLYRQSEKVEDAPRILRRALIGNPDA